MKNYRCSKLIVLLLAILIAAIAIPAMAEEKSSAPTSTFVVLASTNLEDGFMKSAPVIVDEKNKTVADFSAADPNGSYTLKLNVANPTDAGDDDAKKLPSDTSKVVVYYTVQNMKAAAGTNGDVSWTFIEKTNQIIFTWPEGEKTSFTVEIPVTPNYPATKNNDLSGSYALGCARLSMLGTRTFYDQEKSRNKLYATVFTVTDAGIRPGTDENPVWVLEHVTGDYYTVRAQNTNKYIYISPNTTGNYRENSLYLVEGTQETAQRILVTDVGDGYYSFTYTYNGKKYAINNSNNDKAGNSAVRGFGCWTYAGQDNEKFKLYSPSSFDNSAAVDLSGTWVITNSNVTLATEASKANNLNSLTGVSYYLNNGVTLAETDTVEFTFEHVRRDWYTVRTDSGYLNISKSGATISSDPMPLKAIITNGNGSDISSYTIMLATGEYLDSGEKYCATYALNFAGNKKFTTAISRNTDKTRMQLVSPSVFANAETAAFLSFNVNGGTAAEVPQTVVGEAGETVVLPAMDGAKNGLEFIGWCELADAFKAVPSGNGTSHTYHDIYSAGSKYTLKAGTNTLYAVYNTTKKNVQFGIRIDGVVQDEPNVFSTSLYTGHLWVNDTLKVGKWIVDINSTKPVEGYTLQNNVTANLSTLPTAEQINSALRTDKNKTDITFDPETQYIHWYVLKYTGSEWHVDGVIRNKTMKAITYNMNVDGAEKTTIKDMPDGREVGDDNTVTVGTNSKGEVTEPKREGYDFVGWSTEADGTGDFYKSGEEIKADGNTNLYAQWVAEGEDYLRITAKSNWPEGKIGYPGAEITLTATLEGFENKTYTLQWQYSEGNDVWTDMPGANEINYTFILQPENAAYIWRAVAKDIQNKE